jgi:mono/diheme cytochrome c family protein
VRRLVTIAAASALLTTACGGSDPPKTQAELVASGRTLFESRCAACHGFDLEGTESGPSFLDPIYAPDHHPDEAFHNAVDGGVVPHHWNFGPMPPQKGFSEADVDAIIAYVRSKQRAAKIR